MISSQGVLEGLLDGKVWIDFLNLTDFRDAYKEVDVHEASEADIREARVRLMCVKLTRQVVHEARRWMPVKCGCLKLDVREAPVSGMCVTLHAHHWNDTVFKCCLRHLVLKQGVVQLTLRAKQFAAARENC